jgi:pimeloyl-ACP methyl ester carboxylesterase
MLWWEEGFCRLIADGGRFVLRYDQRDTGRSVTYPAGAPEYTAANLITDALGILDAYGIAAAHIVGLSAGGGMAQELTLLHSDRVLSLTLMSTSPATPGDRELPPPTEAFNRFVANASVEWEDPRSVINYLVDYERLLAGDERPFDENARRTLITRDVERARDPAAMQNHDLLAGGAMDTGALSALDVPTLVIHGTADPMFPIAHGEALAAEIPGATLLPLNGAGHGLVPKDWRPVAAAVLEHTATT